MALCSFCLMLETPFAWLSGKPVSLTPDTFDVGTSIVAVAFGGIETCKVKWLATWVQEEWILPITESYVADALLI